MKQFILISILILSISGQILAQNFQSYVDKADSAVVDRQFSQAINLYKKAITSKPERIITELDEVIVFFRLGNVYTEIAEYQTALEYFFKFLEKDVVKNSDSLLSGVYNSIGVNYNYLNQEDQALKFYKKCVETAGRDSIKIGGAYNNMANIYQKEVKLKTAKDYYKKALFFFEEKDSYRGIVTTVMNIGIIELEENKIENALSYFNRAKELAKEQHDTLTYIVVSINLGDFYTTVTDYEQAERFLNWALENSKTQNARMYIKESYKSLVNLYKTKEDFEKAFQYLELFKASSDSIFNQNSGREYAELEAKFSVNEKEKEKILLKKEQEFVEAQIKLQEKYIWMLSVLVILAIIFIILFYLQRKKLSKSKLDLENQNKEINRSQKQLKDLNHQYEKLIDQYEGGVTDRKPEAELS